jgi:hypothetical protein
VDVLMRDTFSTLPVHGMAGNFVRRPNIRE